MGDISIMGAGAVIPPESKSNTIDLGDKALEVKILDTCFNEGDDCLFVRCKYPDGLIKNHQVFLTQTTDDLLPFIINTFRARYGRSVVPTTPMAVTFEHSVGRTLKFTEDA